MFHETPQLSRRQMLAAGLGLSCTSFEALAQEWPSKSLSFVVPFPAGGSNDIVARLVAEGVGKRLGQTVVIDNRSGASGALGGGSGVACPQRSAYVSRCVRLRFAPAPVPPHPLGLDQNLCADCRALISADRFGHGIVHGDKVHQRITNTGQSKAKSAVLCHIRTGIDSASRG